MWLFQKTDPLRLLSGNRHISVVGAGGKSTLIEYIARRQASSGRTVAITTTTKIYAKEPFVLFPDLGPPSEERIIRVGKTRVDKKLTGLSFDEVNALGERVDMVLIEADGAKHLPLKYPSDHEPLIAPFSDRVCVVAGLDALYGRVDEKVFRWELFRGATGTAGDAIVSPEVFLSLFTAEGMLKGVERTKCTVFLNKYDSLRDKNAALKLAKGIIEGKICEEVVVSSPFFDLFYRICQI